MNFSKFKKNVRDKAAIGKRIGIPAPNIIVMNTIFKMVEYL
jgi:hypothetical protein|tara:strand:- start:2091 stop:2213 length:123 start_codon:yes stop_codon:yes gene_type:complete